jgi:aminopeptidase YwaD
MMKRRMITAAGLLAALLVAGCTTPIDDDDSAVVTDDDDATPFEIDGDRIWDDVAELASDEYGGRFPGTEGGELALLWVEELLASLPGATPSGDAGAWRWGFTFEDWQVASPTSLVIDGAALTEGQDFETVGWSGGGDVEGELVFAGYGVTVPAFEPSDYPGCPLPRTGYDDYEGLDVQGKIVVLMIGVPTADAEVAENCPGNEAGPSTGVLWYLDYKVANAELHGAAGVLITTPWRYGPTDSFGDRLYFFLDLETPAVHVDRDLIESYVPDMQASAQAIDDDLTPAGLSTGVDVSLRVHAAVVDQPTANLLAVYEGTDPVLADEVIVIGAHIDHVGTDPVTGEVYNGADDNASGSAVLMELARAMQSRPPPSRTVMLAWWNAEELGLFGSCDYVDLPVYPLDDTVAMFSVDMVGGGDATGLELFGANDPGNGWLAELMEAAASEAGVEAEVEWSDPLMASDHACFDDAGIPALLVSTLGEHPNYHTPQDDAEAILPDDLEVAARLMWRTLEALADGREDELLR